ncbi:SMI1/KNR4 family protein [Streptomyces avicenniae]|uniref:SMI1/KNR4 family protein n=1 Tax=Streptomyces avicenniae TaxID=500153 RepID=UPI00069C0DB7|nr:SMI1/KNR4 family protein [Streptomyces avicenniae]
MVEKADEGGNGGGVGAEVAAGVGRAWDRMEAWLAAYAPLTLAALPPPAARADVEALEREVGVALPADLVASLLRHDGQADGGRAGLPLPGGHRLLDVAGMARHAEGWRSFARREGEDGEHLRDGSYWHLSFVRFTLTVAGDGLLLDCRPGAGHGRVGSHTKGVGPRLGGWPSFTALLTAVADGLEEGHAPGGFPPEVPVTFAGRLLWEPVPEHCADAESSVALGAGVPPREWPGGRFFVTVVRGLGQEEVLTRLGAPPVAPGAAREPNAALPSVRVGRSGEWAFVVERDQHEAGRPEALRRLSRGTVAATATLTGPVPVLVYRDGVRWEPRRIPAAGAGTGAGGGAEGRGLGSMPGVVIPAGPKDVPAQGVALRIGGSAPVAEPVEPVEPRVPPELVEVCERLSVAVGVGLTPEEVAGVAGAARLVPVLPVLPDVPPWSRPSESVAEVVVGIPDERLGPALVAATARMAEATGLAADPVVAGALADLRAGRAAPVDDDSPLGLRLRTVLAEEAAPRRAGDAALPRIPSWPERRTWLRRAETARALLALAALPPRQAADHVLTAHPSPHWRAELLRDASGSADEEV